jgi:hypothetical protein
MLREVIKTLGLFFMEDGSVKKVHDRRMALGSELVQILSSACL